MDAARTASLKGRAYIRDNEAKEIAELKEAGMQVESQPDIEAFRKATASVVEATSGDTRKIIEEIRKVVK
jgi:TRAP-type C4-dicarboxylate transport system substrate-binding protein